MGIKLLFSSQSINPVMQQITFSRVALKRLFNLQIGSCVFVTQNSLIHSISQARALLTSNCKFSTNYSFSTKTMEAEKLEGVGLREVDKPELCHKVATGAFANSQTAKMPLRESLRVPFYKFAAACLRNPNSENILDDMVKATGYKPTLEICDVLMYFLGLNGDHISAKKVYDSMLKLGLGSTDATRHSLLLAHINGNDKDNTLKVFESLFDIHNPASYDIIIQNFVRLRRVQEAFNIINYMKSRTVPTIETYNILIRECAKFDKFIWVWAAYNKMRLEGFQPNSEIYSLLITCASKHYVGRALNLYEEMLQRKLSIDHKITRLFFKALSSNAGFYTTSKKLLDKLIAQQQTQDSSKPDVVLLSTILKAASFNKDIIDARQYFFLIHQTKAEPDVLLMSYSYLFDTYAAAFDVNEFPHGDKKACRKAKAQDLEFFQGPPPTCIEDCVDEAIKLLPFLDLIEGPKHAAPYPWISFLALLSKGNYFALALEYFGSISGKFSGTLYPKFYICMLELACRFNNLQIFNSVLENTNDLLRPILPDSSLSENEKIVYKHVKNLDDNSIQDVFCAIILGQTNFDLLHLALKNFSIVTTFPKPIYQEKLPRYAPFFDAVEESEEVDTKTKLGLNKIRGLPLSIDYIEDRATVKHNNPTLLYDEECEYNRPNSKWFD